MFNLRWTLFSLGQDVNFRELPKERRIPAMLSAFFLPQLFRDASLLVTARTRAGSRILWVTKAKMDRLSRIPSISVSAAKPTSFLFPSDPSFFPPRLASRTLDLPFSLLLTSPLSPSPHHLPSLTLIRPLFRFLPN